jgi:hypothetical protein
VIRKAWVLLAVVTVGCGGKFVGVGPSDGSPDASGNDSSDDAATDAATDAPIINDAGGDAAPPWSPVCPTEQPAPGSACSASASVECEYGRLQYDIGCDLVLECTDGVWQSATLGPSSCQPDGPNSAACPASLPTGVCNDNNLRCEYPEGVCQCSAGFGGPIELDGGLSWFCNPGKGCPMPRPRLGSSCATGDQNCTYLTCEFAEDCQDGYWQGQFEACATPGVSH